MWSEFEIQAAPKKPQYLWFLKKRYRVGSGLRNDITIFHRDVPDFAGVVEREGVKIYWTPAEKSRGQLSWGQSIELGNTKVRVVPLRAFLPLCLGLFFSLFIGMLFQSPKISLSDVSSVASSELPSLPTREKHGWLHPSSPRVDRVSFQFSRESNDSFLLHYTPGNIMTSNQVSILINEKAIGFVSPSPKAWGMEERVLLSRKLLQKGTNVITFVDHDTKNEKNLWGVRDLYVEKVSEEEVVEDVPTALFQTAQKLYQLREVRRGQLHRAKQILEKAMGRWQAQGGSVPQEAQRLREQIQLAEEEMLRRGNAEAQSAIALGHRRRAREIYDAMLAELIDSTDPRRRELEQAKREVLR